MAAHTQEFMQRLADAQALLAKSDYSAAHDAIQALLEEAPGDPNARYLLALHHRLSSRPQEALAVLEKLVMDAPEMGRAHQEIAVNALALNNPQRALAAAETAVAHDPSLLKCWQLLVPLHRSFRPERLAETQQQVEFVSGLPSELRTVVSYLSANQLQDAERLCKYYLRQHKTHPEGMRLLAEIFTRQHILDEAQYVLETLTELEPSLTTAKLQLFHVLMRRQRFHAAFDIAQKLQQQYPDDNNEIKRAFAAAAFAVGLVEIAQQHYLELRRSFPNDHLLAISQGHVYAALGKTEEAVSCFRESAEIKPGHGDSYWSLANTKSYRFEADEIDKMQSLEKSGALSELDRIQICFAAGKALEDAKSFDEAFSYYAKGNALKHQGISYDPEQLDTRVTAQINTCIPELFQKHSGGGDPSIDPIFIVGLPRAGSTLLEQILASHSRVDGTMELHNILDLAKRLRGRDGQQGGTPRYPGILDELDTGLLVQFGQQFMEQTRVYRGGAPLFIDKMPNNFFHIGLIKLILPNAKVIDARRHPMACCFSGFKQLFGEGQEFSYSLEDIGEYYRQYARLMDHWDRVLPGFVLRVQHEDVVADIESQVRRMLDFCGLEFEPACLEFYQNKRVVRTPSAEQVRQPIYTSGLDQWRNFDSHLTPLKRALGEQLLSQYHIDIPHDSQ